MYQWKLNDAGREFDRPLRLNPYHTATYFAFAEYLVARGRQTDAIGELERALKIGPLSMEIRQFFALGV